MSVETRVTERAETVRGGKRHGGPRWMLFGCGGLFATFLAAGFGYLAWANAPLPPLGPAPDLPSPNGRDVCVAALANRPATPKESVLFHPDTGSLAKLRQELAKPDPAGEKVRAALSLPYANPQNFDINASFPELAHYRDLVRRWTARARIARESGDPRKAIEHCLDGLELGSRVPHGAGLLHHMVGVALQFLPLHQAERTIPELSAKDARAARARLDRIIRQNPDPVAALGVERRAGLTWARDIFGGRDDLLRLPGQTQPAFTHPLVLAFYPKPWTYQNMEGYYQASLAEAKKPYPARTVPEVPRDPFCMLLLPAFNSLSAKLTERDAVLHILRLELALQEYRAVHGRYPADLEALKGIPAEGRIDPFTTRPFIYRLKNGKYLLYSFGANGKDDGGVPQVNRKRNPGGPGDFVAGALKEKD